MRHLVLTILLSLGTLQAAEIPATPAGAALERWLEVVRGGDASAHHASAFAPSFTSQVGVEAYVQLCAQLKPLLATAPIVAVDEKSAHALSAWARTPAGTFEVVLQLEAAEPNRIETLLVRPSSPPSAERPFPSAGTLAQLLEHAREVGGYPAIAGAHMVGDELRAVAAVGVRRFGDEATVGVDDAFHIGSVTKAMTATMLARLIEAGTLDWETTVGEALDGVPMLDVYRSVTLHQLLRHRGGLIAATGFGPEEMARWTALEGDETAQRAAFVAHALQQEPVADPGTQTLYSNAGYTVAAHIAERRSGKSWSALMREQLFAPLGLKSAGFGWPERVSGHRGAPDNWAPIGETQYPLGEFIDPAGDLHMHVADLARFARAHLVGLGGGEGLLKPETFRKLHTPPDDDPYACGWIVSEVEGKPLHWHNGSVGTFYSMVTILPESDEVIALLFNAAPGAEALAREITRSTATRAAAP